MITGIRIRNLRSLTDTGHIQIKPLNLLVGTNSSGKSTFLRTFPLLKQSIENATAGPILWWGRHVDYGSLRDAITKNASPQEFSIELSLRLDSRSNPFLYYGPFFDTERGRSRDIDVSLTLRPIEKRELSYVSSLRLAFEGNSLTITALEDGRVKSIVSNGHELVQPEANLKLVQTANLIPSIIRVQSTTRERAPYIREQPLFAHEMATFIATAFDKRVAKSDRSPAMRLMPGLPEKVLEQFKTLSVSKKWKSKTASLTVEDSRFKQILAHVFANWAPWILRIADENLAISMRHMSYVQPFRMSTNRYYRIQDLSVNEIDPRGENLAMFFRSLSRPQQKSFTGLVTRFLNVRPGFRTSEGHIELLLQEGGPQGDFDPSQAFNLSDVGYGYSQVLPVFAQVWLVLERQLQRENAQAILAIEQPEVHLHPAAQSLLADLFVSAVGQTKNKESFAALIETHSEALINRLGRLIQLKRIDPEDIQILVFTKNQKKESEVRVAKFSSEGELLDWPYGFFLPEVE